MVLAVLGILSALSAPSVSRWVEDYRVRGASRQLMSDLEAARMLAVTQNAQYRVYFNQAGNQYWSESQNPATLVWSKTGTIVRQLGVAGNPAYEKGVILSFSTGGDKNIVFTPLGQAPGGITAMLSSTDYQRNVVVATTGRVSIVQIK